jgi:hypothetical protein
MTNHEYLLAQKRFGWDTGVHAEGAGGGIRYRSTRGIIDRAICSGIAASQYVAKKRRMFHR